MSYHTSGRVLPVLESVDLVVAAGSFVSLLGPSGGGKSTLLNILAGLEAPNQGRVLHTALSGTGLPGPPDDHGSQGRDQEGPKAAYMHQKDLLLPWRSLWDNVLLGPELRSRAERSAHEARATALIREYGLTGFENAYPAQLSGGMRQRAALIRTLLCDHPLLLLDEPFGALDALTRSKLQTLLLDVWRRFNKTVVLVTHDVEEAVLLSDRIVLLSGRPGRVVGEFTVPHPHAVRRESPETLRLKNRILKYLEADAPLG